MATFAASGMKKLVLISLLSILSGFSFSQDTKDNEKCRALYNEEKFEEAYQCYKEDGDNLFSVYMSAYLAKFLEYKKDYKSLYKKLLSDKFDTSEKYYYCAYLHPKNSKKFLKMLDKGLKAYPSDTLLMVEKVNYFIEIKDYEEGLPILNQLLELKSDDLFIYLTMGNIYNWEEKYQKAIPHFQKALEIDSKNLDANYGLGLIYYNQAVTLIQTANTTDNQEEAKRLENEAMSLLTKALPYLETAYRMEVTDNDLKSALLTCYLRLGMDDEYNALKDS